MSTLNDKVGKGLPDGRLPRSGNPWQWQAGYILFIGLSVVASILGIPFVTEEPIRWEEMNTLLLAGTIALAAANLCHAVMNFSTRDAIVCFGLAFGISWAAECAGVRWGPPFGHRYYYHVALVPTLPRGVPLFIPLAWFVLARTPLILLRDLSVLHTNGTLCPHRLLLKAALCALFLAACDLILDPLAISVEAWTWEQEGRYFGMPYLNLSGWFLVGFAIYLSYFSLQVLRGPRRDARSFVLDATYVAVNFVFLALVVVAVLNRLGSIVPIVLSIGVMTPYWIFWFATVGRHVSAASSPGCRS